MAHMIFLALLTALFVIFGQKMIILGMFTPVQSVIYFVIIGVMVICGCIMIIRTKIKEYNVNMLIDALKQTLMLMGDDNEIK